MTATLSSALGKEPRMDSQVQVIDSFNPERHRRFRLRWRLEYLGRPARYGGWDRAAQDDPHMSAWLQPKEGLLFAVVEAEDVATQDLLRVLECPGPLFCNFEWKARAFWGGKESGILASQLTGLGILSERERVVVFGNGNVKRELKNPSEQSIHFHYGRT
jgi:hypothetical protein